MLAMRFDEVDEFVRIEDVECLAETDRAILCRSESWDGEKVWVPKSVLGEETEVGEKGDEGVLVVARWFAKKENLA